MPQVLSNRNLVQWLSTIKHDRVGQVCDRIVQHSPDDMKHHPDKFRVIEEVEEEAGGRVVDDEEGEADEEAGDEEVETEDAAHDEGGEGEEGTAFGGGGRRHVSGCWRWRLGVSGFGIAFGVRDLGVVD